MKEAAATPSGPRARLRTALGALLLVAATLAAYAPALEAGYVWDDDDYVTENPLLWEPDGLRRIWLSAEAPSQYFPLVYTSYRLEYALWGLEPFGYHLVNVLLHAANALLVWRILALLAVPGAGFAAALFALHPVHVESVAWISERKNTLSTLFFLLSLLAWLRYTEAERGKPRYYVASLASYQLALFAKTTACVLPAALILALWYREEKLGLRRWLETIPYVALGLIMGLVAIVWERLHQGTVGERFAAGWPEAILVAGRALWFYLGKLVFPHELSFSYPRFEIDASDPLHWLPPATFLLALFLLWLLRARLGRGPVAALAFFAASLSPLLGFIPLYTFLYTWVADHYQYVASLGPLAWVAGAGAGLAARAEPRARIALAGGGLALLVVLGVLSFRQAAVYESRETLWRDVIAKNPGSWMAHHNLGEELLRQRRLEEAVPAFRAALALRRDLDKSHRNLGITLWRLGRLDAAQRHLEEAVQISPDFFNGRASLAGLLVARGAPEAALAHYDRMIALAPARPEGHAGRGRALAAMARKEAAQAAFREALRVSPEYPPALLGLANLLARCPGDPSQAREALSLARRALAAGHRADPRAWAAMARARAAAGRMLDAQMAAGRAVALARRGGLSTLATRIATELDGYRRGELWCPDADGRPYTPEG